MIFSHHIKFVKISLQEDESVWEKQDMLSQEQAYNLLRLYLIGYTALKLHYNQSYTCTQSDLSKFDMGLEGIKSFAGLIEGEDFLLLKAGGRGFFEWEGELGFGFLHITLF